MQIMNSIEEIISSLNLKPHPEGGYFRETYRSENHINEASLTSNYKGKRNYSTCIYFLLTSDIFSAFHRIQQDEIWHFYSGSPIRLHTISETGKLSEFIIGNDFSKGQVPQLVVPGGYWFGAEVINPNDYSLVGCTVSPGFDFADFELPTRQELISLFPENEKVITRLTKP
jgi:uncharacterized protein